MGSTQIINWINKHNAGESFEDYRGRWNKKHFSSHEEEHTYLKAQIEYLKKQNPNLHGEEKRTGRVGTFLTTLRQFLDQSGGLF
ncbi:hypothetical protein EL26_23190 [Tumebacillus flagellatus]|uniref:Transposase n=1 Tax=Tumebacillus flagellatus TaxID=1157490 RepID=A0A074LIL9_9BACL|nr:hypothetical protein EL26_23190 [Tumebacillus flagellatus]